MSAADIHSHLTEVDGTEAISGSKVRKWVKKFKDGRINDTEPLGFRGPNKCNYSPTNRVPISKTGSERILKQGRLRARYASVPLQHGGTLNSRRAASPFIRLVEGEERWEAPDHLQGVLLQNGGETELNRSVIGMVLKAIANDKCHFATMNFVGLDLVFANQVALVTTQHE
ncbi:uncharacterized protein TNCV_1306971 [Trichonephila clavipes]|nr:uncharacterized protein TNCV_1306971 [Trichonephila clavipes]